MTMYNTIVCEKNTTSPLGTSRPQIVHIRGDDADDDDDDADELECPSTVVRPVDSIIR